MKKDFSFSGLTFQEVKKRLEENGPNELRKAREITNLKIILSQFKSPLIYILLLAGIVTFFLGEFKDTFVILGAVSINTIVGFYQERKAQRSLEALRDLLTPQTKVIRDGKQQIIQAKDLVVGDLAVLTIGSRVPADGVLLEATDLTINEAILTGESMPVGKDQATQESLETSKYKKGNIVFAGSIISSGIGRMLVTKTGMNTEIGKIGRRIAKLEEEKTPLQIQIGKLARYLAIAVGVITVALFIFGEFLGYGLLEMFTISVAVAVAAIPEGLPISLTVILALGMQRILKRKALVRKLLAAETLGSVSVICADKTGTLTEGQMRVVESVLNDENESKDLLTKAAILCNDMRDPLETSMRSWAEEKMDVVKLQKDYPRLDEIPFNPKYKYVATLHQGKKDNLLFFSGAPEIILHRSSLTKEEIKNWEEKFKQLAEKGYRLVGFAYKNSKLEEIERKNLHEFNWLGVLVYEDPIREGVKLILKQTQEANIKIKVITGDYPATALAVLKKLNLADKGKVLEGKDLEEMTEKDIQQKVKEVILFARTTPEQKLKIVKALKANGEVVAMMGDGVNDAPALKQADIGIVVGQSADVARQTADIVLLDSNFATIFKAIESGRAMFENIRKVVLYLFSDSFSEVILIGGSLFLGLPLPVTAVQILWVNLVQDSFPAISLAFERQEKGIMQELPRKKETPILDSELKFLVFVIGMLTNFILLGLFYLLAKGYLVLVDTRTVMFVALGIDSLFVIFACRSLRRPIFSFNPFSNKILTLSVAIGLALILGAVYLAPLQRLLGTQPLGIREWIFLISLGIFNILAIEITKGIFIASKKRRNK